MTKAPVPVTAPVSAPATLQVPKIEAPVTPEIKMDIVNDPLSFLLSDSVADSSAASAAPTPSPRPPSAIPSAPAPPPLQPSYSSIATGDAISELRARFNETPTQASFNDPVVPQPHVITAAAAAATTANNYSASPAHNPPSKMYPPAQPAQPAQQAQQVRSVPASPPKHSSREEVVSPNTQRKRLMAQCMSEAAGMKNASILPSQVKAAKRKTTKSRVERFIEATCGEPQTVVRKTASGQEYLEVISPESTELARSLLEPSASR